MIDADLTAADDRILTMPSIDPAAFADLTVLDPQGNDVAIGSLSAEQPVALALVRHFG